MVSVIWKIAGILGFLFCMAVAFYVGVAQGYNEGAKDCFHKQELDKALNDLETGLNEQMMDLLNTYEINCPHIYEGLLNNTVQIVRMER